MKYTIVVTYSFTSAWLQKTWEERGEYEEKHLRPIFAKYADRVQPRFFDAEAFHADFSDFLLLETQDIKHYYYLIEELRESQLFKDRLVEFKQIMIGIEDGFRDFERDVLKPEEK
jgi:hypothetical protein